jgi:ribonuclease BN (tRNA processing enzyme)
MRLDVIGAGPAYSDRAGATGACYLLRHAGASLVLDLGQGSFPRLAGLVDPAEVEAVVISHLHPDHYIDVVPLRHYLRYEKPRRRVRVIAPGELEPRLDALHGEPGFSAQSLDIEALRIGTIEVGPFALEARHVTHTDDSYGFRVTPVGRVDAPGLVYSGDCGNANDIDPLMRPGDTLLCEVSFGPGPVVAGAGHLGGRRSRPAHRGGPGAAHAPADGIPAGRDRRQRARPIRWRPRRAHRSGLRDLDRRLISLRRQGTCG